MHAVPVQFHYLRDARALYGTEGLLPATPDSAGFDLRACPEKAASLIIPAGERLRIPCGIAIAVQDRDCAAFVYSRSGLGAVHGLTVAQGTGVIDSDYRGEIFVILWNTSGKVQTVQRGDRIAQLIFQPVLHAVWQEVSTLDSTLRGSGGFGHTGR